MRFTATQWDGRTTRHLVYTLTCDGRLATLKARWVRPTPTDDFQTVFLIDPMPLSQALPDLVPLQREMEGDFTGMDTKELVAEHGAGKERWRVSGTKSLSSRRPELRPWVDLWRWLDDVVEPCLPFSLD